MSEIIEFTPKGLFVRKWSSKKNAYIRKRPKKFTICTHLRSPCEITEGTTLRHIFKAVKKYKFLKTVIAQYSWCSAIDEFHEQAEQEFDPVTDTSEKIDYLEISHGVQSNSFIEKKKHPGGLRERTIAVDFYTYPLFVGIGKDKEDKEISYSISYTPMYKLADLPVKINKKYEVRKPFNRERPHDDKELLFENEKPFSLLEILDAIYWDISFMGSPEDNKEFVESTKLMIEQIQSGQVAGIPLEQVQKRLTGEYKEPDPDAIKVILHPELARQMGVNPDEIPLDDKHIIRNDENENR